MKKASVISILISVGIIGIPCIAYAQKDSLPEILICLEGAKKSGAEKLVYTYIDSVKTECMTRPKLMALINSSRMKKDSIALEEKNRDARKRKAASDDIVDQIIAGKKDCAGVDLKNRDLMGIDLSSVDLTGANLESADLRNAKLSNAILKNANLKSAFLRKTDLRGADLTGANLDYAIFLRADLRGAKGFSIDNMNKIRTVYESKLDSALAVDALDEYPEKFKPPRKCWDTSWARNFNCDENYKPKDDDK
jgi:hypothetical protein